MWFASPLHLWFSSLRINLWLPCNLQSTRQVSLTQSIKILLKVSFQADGLGTYSLSIIYAALIVSSQFTPSLVIKYAGAKWTMVGCMLCYTLYIGAQFYPTFYTLLPAAAILGTAAAPLWIAKCDYLTKVRNSITTVSDFALNIVIFAQLFATKLTSHF